MRFGSKYGSQLKVGSEGGQPTIETSTFTDHHGHVKGRYRLTDKQIDQLINYLERFKENKNE